MQNSQMDTEVSMKNMSLLLTPEELRSYIVDYSLPLVFLLGMFGSIMTVILFSRNNAWKHSCCLYFLAATYSNMISLICGIIPMFAKSNHVDPSTYSLTICKFQGFLTHTSLQMSRVFVVLSCFDSYALTSSNIDVRRHANVRLARKLNGLFTIFCILLSIHLLIYLKIENNQCDLYSSSIALYNYINNIITISIVIPILMVTFSILTYLNLKKREELRRNRRRKISRRCKRREQKVLITLMMKLILYFVSTVIYAFNTFYNKITKNMLNKSSERTSIESFTDILGEHLIYLYPTLSFYIFIFASNTYRH